MAITRAQQFKQMLREGGRIGFQGGGKDMGKPGQDRPSFQPPGFDIDTGKFKRPDRSDEPSRTQKEVEQSKQAAIAQGRFKKKDPIRKFAEDYTKNTRKFLYNTFPNNPRNELDYLRSLPASQRALLSPALRAKLEELEDAERFDDIDSVYGDKFTFNEFEELRKFQPTEGLNFAEYAAKFKGAPGLLYSGDVGNLIKTRNPDGTFSYKRDFSQDDPSTMESDLEARLRLLEEQRKKVEEPVAENPLANLFARLAADGGMIEDAPRVGIMGGGMLVQPGFGGTRQGYRGDAAARASGAKEQGRVGGSDVGESSTRSDPRDDGPDRTKITPRQNITQRLVTETDLSPKEIRKLTGNQTFVEKFGPAFLKAGAFAALPNPVIATIGGKGITLDQALAIANTGKNIADLYRGEQGVPAALTDAEKDLERLLKTKGLSTETDETQLGTGDILTGPVDITDPNFEKAAGSIKRFKDAVDSEGNKMFSVEDIIDSKQDVENIKNLSDQEIRSIFDQVRLPTGDLNRMPAAEGGIMDLETGRQMYFLGKLVKKATRAVKKIVKSPLGKAAILGGLGYLGVKGGLGTFLKEKALDFGLYKAGEGLTGKGMLALGGALTAAPLLFGKQEDDDDTIDPALLGPRFDIARLLARPYEATLGQGFVRSAADGGRIGYQEGSKEPVAKKTMPLLDMGGQEMDLRDNGGFVPIGRMEKADDVPARLSKNEFVFTADAVRNAGDGDIDKGAEVMYNMMKNLEDGGNVSEESQGLEGARNMFQTAQRLEEVL